MCLWSTALVHRVVDRLVVLLLGNKQGISGDYGIRLKAQMSLIHEVDLLCG